MHTFLPLLPISACGSCDTDVRFSSEGPSVRLRANLVGQIILGWERVRRGKERGIRGSKALIVEGAATRCWQLTQMLPRAKESGSKEQIPAASRLTSRPLFHHV